LEKPCAVGGIWFDRREDEGHSFLSPLAVPIHQEDVAVTIRSRFWLAAMLGMWGAFPLRASEPARLSVQPTSPSLSVNQQIANTAAQHLRQSGQLKRYSIDITFQDGLAELTGHVADQFQREEAVRIVQGVPGVERVRDRLVVTGAPIQQAQAQFPPGLPEPGTLPPKVPVGAPPPPGAPPREPVPMFGAGHPPGDINPPQMPPYAWPTFAPYNNYSRVGYPNLYPYQQWPFIGPMYPFPKVPLGWRSVQLTWHDGHWWYGPKATGHDYWRVRFW
jgi:hypothetical protein